MRTRGNSYPWIELGARQVQGMLVRSQFVRADDEEAVTGWRWLHGNTDVYRSACQFKKTNWNDGHTCDFFLEIDGPDLSASRAATLAACRHFMRRVGVQPESFDIVFNGHNGFSLVIPHVVFGQPEHNGLTIIWQHVARHLHRRGLCHICIDAYQPEWLRRFVNSRNSRTGLYAVPLEYQELADLDVDYVTELARQEREHDSMALPAESDKAVGWLHRALEWAQCRTKQASPRAGGEGRPADPIGRHTSHPHERPRPRRKRTRKAERREDKQLLLFDDE